MSNFLHHSRALILAGGDRPATAFAHNLRQADDLIIAADSGAMIALENGWPCDCLIGDFDSLPEHTVSGQSASPLQKLQFAEAELIVKEYLPYPPEKDFSDLELALQWAAQHQVEECLILGALGGRLDHLLFNVIAILELADTLGLKAEIVHEKVRVFQLDQEKRSIELPPGALLSIIALDASSLISLEGTKWPLTKHLVKRGQTLCLSNEVKEPAVTLEAENGRVIVVIYEN